MADTGFGADVTFGTQGFDPDWRTIDPPEETIEDVNTSHLGTTGGYETYMAGDLIEGGELSGTAIFDPDDQPTIGGAAETITLTFPTPAGGSSGATYSFSGYIKANGPQTLETNGLMEQNLSIKVAGAITKGDST